MVESGVPGIESGVPGIAVNEAPEGVHRRSDKSQWLGLDNKNKFKYGTHTEPLDHLLKISHDTLLSKPGLSITQWFKLKEEKLPFRLVAADDEITEDEKNSIESEVWIESDNIVQPVRIIGLSEQNLFTFLHYQWNVGHTVRICDGPLLTTLLLHLSHLESTNEVDIHKQCTYDEEITPDNKSGENMFGKIKPNHLQKYEHPPTQDKKSVGKTYSRSPTRVRVSRSPTSPPVKHRRRRRKTKPVNFYWHEPDVRTYTFISYYPKHNIAAKTKTSTQPASLKLTAFLKNRLRPSIAYKRSSFVTNLMARRRDRPSGTIVKSRADKGKHTKGNARIVTPVYESPSTVLTREDHHRSHSIAIGGAAVLSQIALHPQPRASIQHEGSPTAHRSVNGRSSFGRASSVNKMNSVGQWRGTSGENYQRLVGSENIELQPPHFIDDRCDSFDLEDVLYDESFNWDFIPEISLAGDGSEIHTVFDIMNMIEEFQVVKKLTKLSENTPLNEVRKLAKKNMQTIRQFLSEKVSLTGNEDVTFSLPLVCLRDGSDGCVPGRNRVSQEHQFAEQQMGLSNQTSAAVLTWKSGGRASDRKSSGTPHSTTLAPVKSVSSTSLWMMPTQSECWKAENNRSSGQKLAFEDSKFSPYDYPVPEDKIINVCRVKTPVAEADPERIVRRRPGEELTFYPKPSIQTTPDVSAKVSVTRRHKAAKIMKGKFKAETEFIEGNLGSAAPPPGNEHTDRPKPSSLDGNVSVNESYLKSQRAPSYSRERPSIAEYTAVEELLKREIRSMGSEMAEYTKYHEPINKAPIKLSGPSKGILKASSYGSVKPTNKPSISISEPEVKLPVLGRYSADDQPVHGIEHRPEFSEKLTAVQRALSKRNRGIYDFFGKPQRKSKNVSSAQSDTGRFTMRRTSDDDDSDGDELGSDTNVLADRKTDSKQKVPVRRKGDKPLLERLQQNAARKLSKQIEKEWEIRVIEKNLAAKSLLDITPTQRGKSLFQYAKDYVKRMDYDARKKYSKGMLLTMVEDILQPDTSGSLDISEDSSRSPPMSAQQKGMEHSPPPRERSESVRLNAGVGNYKFQNRCPPSFEDELRLALTELLFVKETVISSRGYSFTSITITRLH